MNNIKAPPDNTKITINGNLVDNKINNPIKMPEGSHLQYQNTVIPKRIRKPPLKINLAAVIDNLSKPETVIIPASPKKNSVEELKTKLKDLPVPSGPQVPDIQETQGTERDKRIEGTQGTERDQEESSPLLDLDVPSVPRNREGRKKKIKRRIIHQYVKKEQNEIPNYDAMTEDERIIHRNSFKLKFSFLRKWHQSLGIPDGVEDNINLYIVHKMYELYLGHIYKEINSNFYRGILLISWLGLELFGTYALGLDATGYVKQQIDLMWAYESIISEMSEVNFYAITANWSPFQKLLGLIFGSFIFMIIIKLILSFIGKKFGVNIEGFSSTVMDFISKMVVSKPQANSVPPVIIQSGPNTGTTGVPELSQIHNVPIPTTTSNKSESQINMLNGAMGIINAISGKGKSTTPTPAVPAASTGGTGGTVGIAPRRIPKPTYSS
ncbi:MAG TPA: hypothetical protein VKR58_05535 [Aquella sp.]|nr:hypothetical protein [Aquella sp.]